MPIYVDNQSAITVANKDQYRARTKHINIHYHYQREIIRQGVVELIYIPTEDMTTDDLTKPLNSNIFRRFIKLLKISESS